MPSAGDSVRRLEASPRCRAFAVPSLPGTGHRPPRSAFATRNSQPARARAARAHHPSPGVGSCTSPGALARSRSEAGRGARVIPSAAVTADL